jgi:hypothetical protein
MKNIFKVGDTVKLIAIPAWLVDDLPVEEQEQIRSFVGHQSTVQEVDKFGYVWVGFGSTKDHSDMDSARYSGHSFAVPPDCLEACLC